MKSNVGVYRRWLEPPPIDRHGDLISKIHWPKKRRYCWVVRWFSPDGDSRYQLTAKTKVEADRIREEKSREFGEVPSYRIKPTDVTIADFVEEFERLRIGASGQRLSLSTIKETVRVLKRLCDSVGADVLLASISPSDATPFVASFSSVKSKSTGKQISKASISKMVRAAKAAFNVAQNQLQYIRSNPFGVIKPPKVSQTSNRYVSFEEFDRLVQATESLTEAQQLWWRTFLSIAYCAGLRLSEIINLTWSDIDFERGQLHIVAKRQIGRIIAWEPKGAKTRSVPIPSITMAAITQLQLSAGENNPYLFIDNDRLQIIEAQHRDGLWREDRSMLNNVERSWRRLRDRAGLRDVSIHDLRRSALTNLARELPIHVVQQIAGHGSITTTRQFYLSVSENDLATARDVMGQGTKVILK